MKTPGADIISGFSRKMLLAMAVLVTLCIAVDSALNGSHIMVFFALIILSVLFFSLYVGSERHKLGVSIACLAIGSIYLVIHPVEFTWWRLSFYSASLYIAAAVLFASWLLTKQLHHHKGNKQDHGTLHA